MYNCSRYMAKCKNKIRDPSPANTNISRFLQRNYNHRIFYITLWKKYLSTIRRLRNCRLHFIFDRSSEIARHSCLHLNFIAAYIYYCIDNVAPLFRVLAHLIFAFHISRYFRAAGRFFFLDSSHALMANIISDRGVSMYIFYSLGVNIFVLTKITEALFILFLSLSHSLGH